MDEAVELIEIHVKNFSQRLKAMYPGEIEILETASDEKFEELIKQQNRENPCKIS